MEDKTQQRDFEFGLRWAILVSLIIFLLLLNSSRLSDCDSCKFEYEGKSYTGEEFVSIYWDICVEVETTLEPMSYANEEDYYPYSSQMSFANPSDLYSGYGRNPDSQ